jgi:hypothetical protein
MACKNFNITIEEKNTVDEVPIIMVDRGNCSFVTKVRNVQEAGGHLALIVNNNPLQHIEEVFMADDGKGIDLVIPGIMITYHEGEILKNFYRKNKDNPDVLNSIRLEVDFEMENRTNVVKLDLFVSSESEKFYEVLNDINTHLVDLKDLIDLNVYYISTLSYMNHNNHMGNLVELKDVKDCYASGRQCHYASGKFGVFDGRVFLDEDVRQKCILKYSKEKKDIEIYLNYMNNFYKNCVNATNFFTNNVKSSNFNADCSSKVMLENKLPVDMISQCYFNSFNITEQIKEKVNKNKNLNNFDNKEIEEIKIYAENILLENDKKKKMDNLISFLPAINVNNRNFWGSWTKDNIIEDICASFLKKPQICYDEGYFKNDDSGYSFKSMFMLYLVLMITNLIIFLICRKMIRRNIVERIESTDINHKINTVVTSYLALRDNK